MATVRKCWQTDCERNDGCCYCEADEVTIGAYGSCCTFVPRIEEDEEDEDEDDE